MRSSVLALLTLCGLAFARAVVAADCPTDAYELWSEGILRGANVFQGRNPGGASNGIGDGDFTQKDFDDLAAAGANYVQISHAGLFAETPPYALDLVAQDNLDRVIAMAGAANLYAVIAFRSGPGRNENAISNRDGTLRENIWTDQAAHDAWVAMVRHTAERYGPNPTVIGYSIMVEPNSYARHGFVDPIVFYFDLNLRGTLEDVNVLYADAVAAIRQVDTETPILLEPEGYGNVNWLSSIAAINDPHMVYTAHDYTPFDYTHEQQPNPNYPGTYDVDGVQKLVNKAFLTTYLQPLQTYVDDHGVPVALTEFGVHRDVPNAAAYLTDRIAIQDLLGSWAVWVWQPSGFDDPFNMHDASSVHDVLTTAWASNCRRAGGTTPGQATVTGRSRKVRKDGVAGKYIPKVKVTIGATTVNTRMKKPKGGYSKVVGAGFQTISARLGKRACHIGATDGPATLNVTLVADETRTVDVFCGATDPAP